MSFREFLQYYESTTWLHETKPLLKLIYSIYAIFITFLIWSPLSLTIILFVQALLLASIRPPRQKILVYLRIVAIICLSTVISQMLFYYRYYIYGEGRILVYLIPPNIPIVKEITFGRGIAIVLDGLEYGLIVSLKIVSMLLASLLLILTTKPGDLIKTLRKIGLPRGVAIATITAIRFIPIIVEEIYSTITLMRLKGEKLGLRNLFKAIKLLLRNVILNVARRGFILGISLKIRGFKGLLPELVEVEYSTTKGIPLVVGALIITLIYLF